MRRMRAEPDQEKTQDQLLEVVPRFLPLGLCVNRSVGTSSENGTRKPLPTRDDGSVLQTHPYGATSDYDRICRREGVLRTLGVLIRATPTCPFGQWAAIRCEVLPSRLQRTRDIEGFLFCLSSPDEWASGTIQSYNC
jgi:hypothetical protein